VLFGRISNKTYAQTRKRRRRRRNVFEKKKAMTDGDVSPESSLRRSRIRRRRGGCSKNSGGV
jgi:hypothetical protein